MNRIELPDGKVLIETLDFLPGPREQVKVDGKTYIVTDDVPVTKKVDLGALGPRYMRVVTAKPESEKKAKQSSSVRGPVVEG